MSDKATHGGAEAGFTLIEVLIATVLMGLILTALATVTAQWLPNWNRGMRRMQNVERLDFGLKRIVDDLSAAEIITPNNSATVPLFDGSELAVTFVRTAIGPNSRPGLEVVRFLERGDKDDGPELVRERVAFAPMETGTVLHFADPVVLIRAPYRVTFSYAGLDQAWQPTWHNATQLPRSIRVTIRDIATQESLALSTVVLLHVDARPACIAAKTMAECLSPKPASQYHAPVRNE
jgi:general secretion pathway protein J